MKEWVEKECTECGEVFTRQNPPDDPSWDADKCSDCNMGEEAR